MPNTEPGWTAFGRRPLSARFAAMLIAFASCALTGCAALSPQIFSDRLSPPRSISSPLGGTSAPNPTESAKPTVPQARADVESVQKKYVKAVQELSQITPGTSVALIGLSAAALYKALTGGSSGGIAALGVAGSGAWATGATLTSQPRQRVYVQGIRSLSCVITAAAPYDRDKTWTDGLDTQIKNAAIAAEDLRDWQEKYANLNKSQTIAAQPVAPLSAECIAEKPTPCPKSGPNVSPKVDEAYLKACGDSWDEWTKKCPAAASTREQVVPAPPDIVNAFKRARDEQARLTAAISSGRSLKGALDVAGSTLQDRSTDIQMKVSDEVLQTEPDPTAVLATLKNLKSVAGIVSGTPLTVPPAKVDTGTGSLQAKGEGQQKPPEDIGLRLKIIAALANLESRLKKSYEARVELEGTLAEVEGAVRKVNSRLDQCEYNAPGAVALVVSPSATSIQVPLGASQSFTVSGGGGIPLVSANGVAGATLGNLSDAKVDRGSFNYTYTVPANGQVGDAVIILFTDAAHQGSHEVTITAAAAITAAKSTGESAGGTTTNVEKPKPLEQDQ